MTFARVGATTIALLILVAITAPARAQPAAPAQVPLMVSRWHKKHNRSWYAKAPRPLTNPCDACPDNCCGDRCCPTRPVPSPCFACPEECCVGSCDCAVTGDNGAACASCPDACCGNACCPPPKPPAACAGCDADRCCHDACQAHVCTGRDAPAGQCDKDQTACENGCCPRDHPFCCGTGLAPFCGATADCGAGRPGDGGEAALLAAAGGGSGHGCDASTRAGAPPSCAVALLVLGTLALMSRRRKRP